MTTSKTHLKALLTAIAAAALTACGGGGGGAGAGGSALPTLSGTAAVGAPLAGAKVIVLDATGAEVGTGETGTDGGFSISLTKEGTAPYVLKLTTDSLTLHAVHPAAASGEVNITPLSEALTAMLSPTGAAADLVQKMPDKAAIESKQEVLTAALSGIATAAGSTENMFTKKFTANGSGVDKVLESIAVSSVADGVNKKASVQIALKLATDPENASDSLPVINLNSQSQKADAVAAVAQLPAVSAADLPDPNAGKLYSELISNLNACYKDKPDVRTDGKSTVLSDACKKIFYNNDPTQYLNFGQTLGANAQFAGMFTYTGEVTFQPTDKPYLVQDLLGKKRGDNIGRAIVGLSWINTDGNRENILLYVAKYKDAKGNELLGLTGDRNQYGWAVNSHNQKREFPLRSDGSLDYVTSAYLISVRDVSRNGKPVDYVEVTTPGEEKKRKKILMAAVAGGAARDLAICSSTEVNFDASTKMPTTPKNKSGGRYACTGTSKAITFAQRFVSDTETRVPSDIARVGILRPLDETGKPYTPTSDVVEAMPSIGLWSITYHFVGGEKVEQKTWSVARPMTKEELMGANGPDAVMAKYTAATIQIMKDLKTTQTTLAACGPTDTNCDAAQSPVPAPTSGGFKFEWTSGSKVPVTSLWASGSKNAEATTFITSTGATAWDDQVNVRSSATSGEVKCSRQTSSDAHCATTVEVSRTGDYNAKTWMSYSELWGKDADQRTFMRSYNWYLPRNSDGTKF